MRIVVALASTLVLAMGVMSPSAQAADTDRLVVFQDAPVLVDHPDPDSQPGKTGHVLFFAGDLRNAKNVKIGELLGQITTFDVTLDGVNEEDRLRELVFNMKKGQIIALGASEYIAATAPDFANDNAPVTAVIVGGTGDYVGARGTVVTKKRPNGTYRHTFQFVD